MTVGTVDAATPLKLWLFLMESWYCQNDPEEHCHQTEINVKTFYSKSRGHTRSCIWLEDIL